MAQSDTCYTRWENLQILNKLDSFKECKQVRNISERRISDLLQSRDDAIEIASNNELALELSKKNTNDLINENTNLKIDSEKQKDKVIKWKKVSSIIGAIGGTELVIILILILL